MCDKCDEIDNKAKRYRNLARLTTDKRTPEGIDVLLADLDKQKSALHLEPEK